MTQQLSIRWSKPKTILVATNLLEGHRLILHAVYQAELSGARVLLVHVVPPFYWKTQSHDGRPSTHPTPFARGVTLKLEEMANELRRDGVNCVSILLKGLPQQQIAELVKSWDVDRVIVGARNINGVARFAEGSVVEDLMASVEVPVCVIGRRARPGAACGTQPGRVLLVTSFPLDSAFLVDIAGALAESNYSQLTLMHVRWTEVMTGGQRGLAETRVERRLCALVSNPSALKLRHIFLVGEGDPAKSILREAGTMSQDLIIFGYPSPSLVSCFLDAGVIHRVIAESECPVMTFKPALQATTEYWAA